MKGAGILPTNRANRPTTLATPQGRCAWPVWAPVTVNGTAQAPGMRLGVLHLCRTRYEPPPPAGDGRRERRSLECLFMPTHTDIHIYCFSSVRAGTCNDCEQSHLRSKSHPGARVSRLPCCSPSRSMHPPPSEATDQVSHPSPLARLFPSSLGTWHAIPITGLVAWPTLRHGLARAVRTSLNHLAPSNGLTRRCLTGRASRYI